ncbi:unnamed protein product, partial [Medioppia subpectinata]
MTLLAISSIVAVVYNTDHVANLIFTLLITGLSYSFAMDCHKIKLARLTGPIPVVTGPHIHPQLAIGQQVYQGQPGHQVPLQLTTDAYVMQQGYGMQPGYSMPMNNIAPPSPNDPYVPQNHQDNKFSPYHTFTKRSMDIRDSSSFKCKKWTLFTLSLVGLFCYAVATLYMGRAILLVLVVGATVCAVPAIGIAASYKEHVGLAIAFSVLMTMGTIASAGAVWSDFNYTPVLLVNIMITGIPLPMMDSTVIYPRLMSHSQHGQQQQAPLQLTTDAYVLPQGYGIQPSYAMPMPNYPDVVDALCEASDINWDIRQDKLFKVKKLILFTLCMVGYAMLLATIVEGCSLAKSNYRVLIMLFGFVIAIMMVTSTLGLLATISDSYNFAISFAILTMINTVLCMATLIVNNDLSVMPFTLVYNILVTFLGFSYAKDCNVIKVLKRVDGLGVIIPQRGQQYALQTLDPVHFRNDVYLENYEAHMRGCSTTVLGPAI